MSIGIEGNRRLPGNIYILVRADGKKTFVFSVPRGTWTADHGIWQIHQLIDVTDSPPHPGNFQADTARGPQTALKKLDK